MPDLVPVLSKLVIFTIMFALGLGLSLENLRRSLGCPSLYLKVLLGTCVVIPLLGLVALKLPLPMSNAVKIAIGLMAVCPSAPMTINRVRQLKGDQDLAAALQVSAAILAVVTVPLMAALYRSQLDIDGWDIRPREVALQISQVQVLPLGCAILCHVWQPNWAQRWQPVMNKVAGVLLALLVLLILLRNGLSLAEFIIQDLLALGVMVVLVGISFALGYFLSGGDRIQQMTVALVTSMRNPGLALLLATLSSPEKPFVRLALLSYLLIAFLLPIPLAKIIKRLS